MCKSCPSRRKKWRKHRAGAITPMSLRQGLHFFPRRRGEVRAHHESGLSRLSLATSHCFYALHETRITGLSNHRLDSLPTIAHHCPLFPGISRQKNVAPSQCQLTVRCSRWASRQAPFAADPVALRARSADAIPTFPQPRRRRFSLDVQGDISIGR